MSITLGLASRDIAMLVLAAACHAPSTAARERESERKREREKERARERERKRKEKEKEKRQRASEGERERKEGGRERDLPESNTTNVSFFPLFSFLLSFKEEKKRKKKKEKKEKKVTPLMETPGHRRKRIADRRSVCTYKLLIKLWRLEWL